MHRTFRDGMHVFSPRIFDSLEYLIKNNLREKGEIQLTAAQEHLNGVHRTEFCEAIARILAMQVKA
jgi:UTP-glucose-1-phosphate uridylyltransferase